MPVVHYSPAQLQDFERSAAKDPAIAKLHEITVQYATAQGGTVLEFWKLHMGRLFGNPWFMTVDECAKRLNMPVSAVLPIAEASGKAIHARWQATPEYQRSDYRTLHEQRRASRAGRSG